MATIFHKAFLLLALVTPFCSALACPTIDGLVDFNCDGRLRISATGDSIVFGVGDELLNGAGGYPARLRRLIPAADVYSLGHPGITSARLLGFYRIVFNKMAKSNTARKLFTSDIIIIDVGRNDYFDRNGADITVGTIKRLVALMSTQIRKRVGTSPLFVVAHLTPSVREFDELFIFEVNELLTNLRSNTLPAYLRYDLLDPLLLSPDGLHPSSAGYDFLSMLADEYLHDEAQERAQLLRPDVDDDGIYDIFEKVKYKTSPSLADTDGDGLKDGTEVFRHQTNPNSPDTDGDGVTDRQEVLQGSNPLVADNGSFPTPTPTPVVTETPSLTPTVTPSTTPTPTATETPTVTPTPTPTPTPTATPA